MQVDERRTRWHVWGKKEEEVSCLAFWGLGDAMDVDASRGGGTEMEIGRGIAATAVAGVVWSGC